LGGCGKLNDLTNALQNAGLLSCGYMTFGVFSFLFYIHQPIFKCIYNKNNILEGPINNRIIAKTIIRIFLCAPSAIIVFLPNLLIKLSIINNTYALLFTNMIVPMIIASWLLFAGPYD
jgi:hypothetical protein